VSIARLSLLWLGLAAPAPIVAQTETAEPTMELGLDASVLMFWPAGGDRLTAVEVPFGRVRLGTYVGPRVLVEVGGGFALVDQSDRSASTARADGALSYHFGSDARRTRLFLLAGGGGRWATSDGTTTGQPFVTAGGGVKVPINRVIGMRIEGDYGRAFSTDGLAAAHEARGLLGISFFIGR
jgi:hypothetical protein